MTNQQGAPEALPEVLRHAANIEHWARGDRGLRGDELRAAAAELRRLHAENERLAALVEAQQPAPSAASAVGEMAAGHVIDLIGKLVQAESNKTRTHQEYMGKAMPDDVYAHFQRLPDETIPALRTQLLDALATSPKPSPAHQADSQPAPVDDFPAGAIINGRALAERLESGYTFECEAGPLRMCSDWQEFVRCFDYLATWVENRAARAPADSVLEDAALMDWLRENTCDLRCIGIPTGGDDYEVNWIVIEHHMAKPNEREIGRGYTDDPRDAIRAARKQGANHD